MKQNRLRTIIAVALAIISMGAWADSRIFIAEMQNGTITASNVAESGEQTVTLTVTPADNYYIETSDIIVSKTSGMAHTRGTTPGFAEKLTVTAISVDNRGKGTYQFTVPEGYGAYVEASFTPCIAITPTVTIAGWTYGATPNEPVVSGNTGNGEVTITYAKKGSDVFTASVPENAGDYTVKASIAANGHYLAGEATADFTIILWGDANNDGVINAADIVEMVNAKNGKQSDRFNLKNADLDGNGNITDTDINEVVKMIMGE